MAKVISILVIIVVLVQTLSLPFLALRLENRREVDAIPMCVNKDDVVYTCYGSCYINKHLAAALAQEDKTDDAPIPSGINSFLQPQFVADIGNLNIFSLLSERQMSSLKVIPDLQGANHSQSCWHPPQV